MLSTYSRQALVALSMAGGLLATPSESHAIFHWFRKCCQPQTTYAVPAPPVCNTCAPQATYVPTTAYRTQIVNVPVTTMRPVQAADPCTGCPVTVMRPVTAFVQQTQMVPYTMFRIVYSNPVAVAAPVMAAPVMAAPMTTVAPAAPSCCGGGAAMSAGYATSAGYTTAYPPAAPATTTYYAQPTTQAAPNVVIPQAVAPTTTTPAPTTSPSPTPALPHTEQPMLPPDVKVPEATPDPNSNIAPPADGSNGAVTPMTTGPRLEIPTDRTASLRPTYTFPQLAAPPTPAASRLAVQPVKVAPVPVNRATTVVDDGWSASSR